MAALSRSKRPGDLNLETRPSPRTDHVPPPRPSLVGGFERAWGPRTSSVPSMEAIVLRVRLTSGDSIDVTYEDRDARTEAEVIDHVVSTLSEASGVLRAVDTASDS